MAGPEIDAAPAKPERAHVVIVKVEADDRDTLVAAMEDLLLDLRLGRLTVGFSAAPSHSTAFVYRHDAAQTHDGYFAQLDAYLEPARRAAARTEIDRGEGIAS